MIISNLFTVNTDLIVARLKAFGFEAGSLILTAIMGVLISPEFSALISTHFGTGVITSVVVLAISGFAKNYYNEMQIKKLGAVGDRPRFLI